MIKINESNLKVLIYNYKRLRFYRNIKKAI